MSSFHNARLKVTERHGKNGIRLVVRVVRQNTGNDGFISLELLRSALRDVDIWIADEDFADIVSKCSSPTGKINSDIFIHQFVGELPSRRRNVVQILWERLDTLRAGYVPSDVLIRQYDVSRHPDVVSRRRSAGDVAASFYSDFSGGEVVTKEELFAYFGGASLATERHEEFELRVARSFNLDRPAQFRALAEGSALDVSVASTNNKSTFGRAHPLYQTSAQLVGSTVADASQVASEFNRKGAFTKNAPPFVGATTLNTSITTTRV